ncbi:MULTISPECIES: FHA domain-containing protein [unclassified Variovorax]|uniref:FHA domain-containing protein n=1 Tax=unclassified Variovorax TaxID=663243 RepID=UPI001316A50A|nr:MULTISPECIES: FHA domain-containing protein [unclassified Variovorax]VTU45490.1 ABC transporter ATP-binding/permease protein [Variovorax sp. PBL-E5]VTU46489.1 ABC transporter ATP-binding/permease protein [Variovorax sp. SRS16]
MPKLQMTSAGETRHVDLKPHENTLGRNIHNDIVLNSRFASRRHAVIVVEAAFTTIRDLASQNGTFVNGVRVQTQSLADGDVIRMGECELHFIAGDQEFSEVVAQRLSSVPNWMLDEHAPTAPDAAGPDEDARRPKST